MKIFLLFFVLFLFCFSDYAYSTGANFDSFDPSECTVDPVTNSMSCHHFSCIGEGCVSGSTDISQGSSAAIYDPVTGTTQIVENFGTEPGIWDPLSFSCSNFVAPLVSASGDLTCPPLVTAKIPKSISNPNPSKDDVACDSSKPVDDSKPDQGCASQKTAAKTNDLISESNSKLGSIASSNVTNSGLLGQILGTLKGIASQGTVGNGTGSDTGDGTGSSDGTGSDTGGVTTSTTQLSSISPTISAFGMCPPSETFNVMGMNYEFSYKSMCDAAESFNGLVIAMGAFSALMIVVTAL